MSDLSLYRAGLQLMLDDRDSFFRSDLFIPFLQLLERRFSDNANSLCRQWGYPVYGIQETASIILTGLLENPKLVHRLLTDPTIHCPFAYLGGRELRGWIGADTGHLPKNYPTNGPRTMYRTSIDAPSFIDRDTHDPFTDAEHRIDQARKHPEAAGAGTLAEAIQLTTSTLTPRTPTRLRPHLPAAVSWMGYNPVERNGHEDTDLADAYNDLPQLRPTHIRAIANACWGTRNAQAQTSILGAYLLNPRFTINQSATHATALANYRRNMHQPHQLMSI